MLIFEHDAPCSVFWLFLKYSGKVKNSIGQINNLYIINQKRKHTTVSSLAKPINKFDKIIVVTIMKKMNT